MAQAALITGDQGSGLETHLHIRVSWGVISENPEGLAAPQACEVSPSGMGPSGQHLSGSSQAVQAPSQGWGVREVAFLLPSYLGVSAVQILAADESYGFWLIFPMCLWGLGAAF